MVLFKGDKGLWRLILFYASWSINWYVLFEKQFADLYQE